MIFSIEINNRIYRIDSENSLDISIPLGFDGDQPNAYGAEKATAAACVAGELIGDTRRGGSCNFEQIKLIPHCNGTHTESIGHLTHERISIRDCLRDVFIPSTLISIEPETALSSNEKYSVELNEADFFISRKSLENALKNADKNWLKGLIVRILPNDRAKLAKIYLKEIPPFFSLDAIQFLNDIGVEHLVSDLPSIDRIFDEGKLANHRLFWSVRENSFEIDAASRINKTITELIYAPNEIADGNYLLNLQIAPFASDAAPSRPILFKTI